MNQKMGLPFSVCSKRFKILKISINFTEKYLKSLPIIKVTIIDEIMRGGYFIIGER